MGAFITNFRPWIGVTFLVVTALLLAHTSDWAWGTIQKRMTKRKGLRSLQRRLHSLSHTEKKLLEGYILNETKTQYFHLDDGVAQGLMQEGIIYLSTNVSEYWTHRFAYNIQPWAWDYLQKHPELVSQSSAERAEEGE